VELACKVLGLDVIPLDEQVVTVSARGLREVFALVLENINVDEVWYKQTYMDVAAAIMSGEIASCREHFVRAGYFEGRLPSEPPLDEDWYLNRYPDIAEARSNGTIGSAKMHFMHGGQQEGRSGIPEHEAAADKWIKLATPED